ncbi:hypothetical protein NCAS_0A02990 [Naumovozyma castellii]|uniref:Uncharacterized protein n=1 Tax=Naumovozyma castellii TaxID=27288 RepID=G0V5W9_NAUCA|nr:hypothetical protein NCAS_0A02990 [Naumovozyma castellii CBS 4309]CCC66857.1 hypothetical protein NCAS_0A02990 [Naumovozyma castellii CBS 4309]
MIQYDEYCKQLQKCYQELRIYDDPLCQGCNILPDELVIQLRIPKMVESLCDSRSLSNIEVRIKYSQIYQEPILLLRLWEFEYDDENDVQILKQYFPKNIKDFLSLESWVQIELDIFSNDNKFPLRSPVWYYIHPCDTSAIVGDNEEAHNDYLSRWFSVFLLNWLEIVR